MPAIKKTKSDYVFDPASFDKRLEKVSGKATNVEIAGICGVSDSIVSRWRNPKYENGQVAKQDPPRTEHLVKLAREYHTSVDYLLGLTEDFEGRKEMTAKQICSALIKILSDTKASLQVNDYSTRGKNWFFDVTNKQCTLTIKYQAAFTPPLSFDGIKYPRKNDLIIDFLDAYKAAHLNHGLSENKEAASAVIKYLLEKVELDEARITRDDEEPHEYTLNLSADQKSEKE